MSLEDPEVAHVLPRTAAIQELKERRMRRLLRQEDLVLDQSAMTPPAVSPLPVRDEVQEEVEGRVGLKVRVLHTLEPAREVLRRVHEPHARVVVEEAQRAPHLALGDHPQDVLWEGLRADVEARPGVGVFTGPEVSSDVDEAAARAVAAASVFTNGRVHCGVSAGWIKEEYDLLGIDFKSRGRRLDETIEVMRKLWSGKSVDHKGEFFEFEGALLAPAPPSPIPIWSGGASKAAFRRAAENDGWLGVPLMADALIETIKGFQTAREKIGKEGEPFDVCCSLIQPLTIEIEGQLEELGAHHNMVLPWVVTPWGRAPWLKEGEDVASLDTKKFAMERFANKVIHRTG